MASDGCIRRAPSLLFTENETNSRRLYDLDGASRYAKDGINDYVVHGKHDAVNRPAQAPRRLRTTCSIFAAGESVNRRTAAHRSPNR